MPPPPSVPETLAQKQGGLSPKAQATLEKAKAKKKMSSSGNSAPLADGPPLTASESLAKEQSAQADVATASSDEVDMPEGLSKMEQVK